MTERLYYEDSYLTKFQATCEEIRTEGEKIFLRLNRTAFYPTSGGQMHDTGWLNDVPVRDVVEKDGEIWHQVAQPLSTGPVQGKIDWPRRFDFMQQHTGFHLLAGAFRHALGLETLSSHLGEEISTIDVQTSRISKEDVRQVEELANQVIAENRPVHIRWVEPDALDTLDLRKMPPDGREKIRLIDIQQFDLDPCGGTHVQQTAEVQLVKILRWEKLRGHLRLYFLAGGRAVRHYSRLWELTRQLNQELTAGEEEILDRVRDLKSSLKTQKKTLRDLKTFWAEQQATILRQKAEQSGQNYVIAFFENADFGDIKSVAQNLARETTFTVALFAVSPSGWRLVLARPEQGNANLRQWLEEMRSVYAVKGGGRPSWVEAVGEGHLEEIARLIEIKMKTEL